MSSYSMTVTKANLHASTVFQILAIARDSKSLEKAVKSSLSKKIQVTDEKLVDIRSQSLESHKKFRKHVRSKTNMLVQADGRQKNRS